MTETLVGFSKIQIQPHPWICIHTVVRTEKLLYKLCKLFYFSTKVKIIILNHKVNMFNKIVGEDTLRISFFLGLFLMSSNQAYSRY